MLQPRPARLPEPAATGLLAKKPLAHLLIYALDRKLTGTFELGDEKGAGVHVVVDQGMVDPGRNERARDVLGHVLYENGFIDDAQLSGSLAEVAATKQLHGQILLEKAAIDAEQLAEGLRQQRARKLQYAFGLSARTTFAFYAEIDLVGERPNDVEPMDPLTCIWRGVREHPSWDHVRTTLVRVGGRPLKLVDGAALDRLGLEPDERAAAECLRVKTSTVPELAIIGGLSIQATDLLAYFLVISKVAEIAERIIASTPPAAYAASDPRDSQGPGLPMRVKPLTSGEYVRKISFAMSAVTPDATTIRIPSPVPNRNPSPLPGRMPSSIPPRMSSLPSNPLPSNPLPPRISSMPGSVASSLPPRHSSAPPHVPGSMAPSADLARKKSIVDRAKWIDQEDYYKMLMVPHEATTEDIRAAFLRAAKVWHPDTLPASIAEVRTECEKVFARITVAYETLVAPDKRRRYEQSIGRQLREYAEADQFLSQAEMHLTLGDRAQAESLARKALVASPGFPRRWRSSPTSRCSTRERRARPSTSGTA